MKCPDCGSNFTDIPFEGGMLHRCFKCGGFWADSYVLNKLTTKDLASWRRISISSSWLSQGKGVCPADGMMLAPYSGESIPKSLAVKRCARCGKWWFPSESLFEYKPAAEAKVSYFRLWGLVSDSKSLLLPVMSVVVLIVGAIFGVNLVQKNQFASVGADSGIRDIAVTYAGSGNAVVVFRADKDVESIAYRDIMTIGWKKVEVQKGEGVYVAQLSGLTDGWDYYFLIGGKEYRHKMK